MGTTSVSEQIEGLQLQIERLKQRSLLELKVKLAEARNKVATLEGQLEKLTGSAGSSRVGKRKPRTSIIIDDVVAAIQGGASNYKAVAKVLGCTPATVTNKVKAEGKSAGISSTGRKAAFKLRVK